MCPESAAPRGATLHTLRLITRSMASAEDLHSVLHSLTVAARGHMDAADVRVYLKLKDHECGICAERIAAGLQTATDVQALHLVATAEPSTNIFPADHRAELDGSRPAAEIMRTQRPFLADDVRGNAALLANPYIGLVARELGVVGMAGYPLRYRDEQLGILGYLSRAPIGAEEFEVFGIFADQAAIAIKNAYLFVERERYRDRLRIENAYLQDEIRTDHGFEHIIGASAALRAVLRQVRQVSKVETTVLLTGETGTGKELVARAIHDESPRKDRPLIKVNCGAIPQALVESELFGHEKGSFTGALQRRIGRFELADTGTLFMDEVGELPLDTQVKLLRVLQEREFERVGSTRAVRVDVRLIAATNRDLDREVKEGRYRPDLFYRLNVFPIRIPPLRERSGDIPLLVQHFLAHYQRKLAKPLKRVVPSAMDQLTRYAWPGNIRELQNVLERACVLARSPEVDLAEPLRASATVTKGADATAPIPTLAENERRQIRRALAAAQGKVHGPTGAAAMLGVHPSTLRSRMQKLGLTQRR